METSDILPPEQDSNGETSYVPPVPPVSPLPEPEIREEIKQKRIKNCPDCGKPGRGPRNGWRCDDHKAQYHAARGGMKDNTPGPPPISEAEAALPTIKLPDELGLAEMGASFLRQDAKLQEAEGWIIILSDKFIDELWLPCAKYLESELLSKIPLDKKQQAGIVVGAPFVNSAAFRVAKRFRKKKAAQVVEDNNAPDTTRTNRGADSTIDNTGQSVSSVAADSGQNNGRPASEENKRAPRANGNYVIS